MEKGLKIGVTAGAFDLCHAGHMLMFKEAKKQCDYLIALLHHDPSTDRSEKNQPIMSLDERMIILQAIKYIDEIRTYRNEKELYILLQELKPNIRIIGADWKNKPFTGYDLPIAIYFNSRNHTYSSSELRERIFESEKNKKRTSAHSINNRTNPTIYSDTV